MRAALLPAIALAGLVAGLAATDDPRDDYHPDRVYVAANLQSLANAVGFGGRFESIDHTLIASDLDLCGEDFLDELPVAWHRDLMAAGFDRFICSGGGVHVDMPILHLEWMR